MRPVPQFFDSFYTIMNKKTIIDFLSISGILCN